MEESAMRMSFSSRRNRSWGARRTVEPIDTLPPDLIDDPEVTEEDPNKPAAARGWYASSLELKHGLEVTDVPLDTLPDDLIDGFTKW
jgi:hypothetical protein